MPLSALYSIDAPLHRRFFFIQQATQSLRDGGEWHVLVRETLSVHRPQGAQAAVHVQVPNGVLRVAVHEALHVCRVHHRW